MLLHLFCFAGQLEFQSDFDLVSQYGTKESIGWHMLDSLANANGFSNGLSGQENAKGW